MTMSGNTLSERYERTMSRLEPITRVEYLVKFPCECDFHDAGIVKQKPELLAHPIVEQSPLRNRDALQGGRNEVIRLHYKARENEFIQDVRVMSLYPYICKYFMFAVGHPIIHFGDAYKDIEAYLRMDGLIKCLIVPREKL